MNIAKENRAIEYLRAFEPHNEPYFLCYSGGKDSDTVRILAELAGVKYDLVHNLTTIDAPETVYYVRSVGAKIVTPPKSMWQLIVVNGMPPTRLVRYCCKALKEGTGAGRVKVTGVRCAESVNRAHNNDVIKIIGKPKTVQKLADDAAVDFHLSKKGGLLLSDESDRNRQFIEDVHKTVAVNLNPIFDWTDEDVWEFLHYHGCESNPLYQCGYTRIGCVGCPMKNTKGMLSDFERYPKYRNLYVMAFDRMIKRRTERGLPPYENWGCGEDVMRWWVYGREGV